MSLEQGVSWGIDQVFRKSVVLAPLPLKRCFLTSSLNLSMLAYSFFSFLNSKKKSPDLRETLLSIIWNVKRALKLFQSSYYSLQYSCDVILKKTQNNFGHLCNKSVNKLLLLCSIYKGFFVLFCFISFCF